MGKLNSPSTEKRSPIKAKPLRHAGQSLDEELRRMEESLLFKYGLFTAGFFGLAAYDWFRYLTKSAVNPWLSTGVAILVFGCSFYHIAKSKRQIKQLELGRDGERDVGEKLDCLRAKGYSVFHDILGEGFNIDHVLLTPAAIFTIETKTRSKPTEGRAKVSYDGKRILVDGYDECDALVQAKAQSHWLGEILLESTGKKYDVRPVILFPGWYVESAAGAQSSGVWVLNPKSLPAFVDNLEPSISDPDLHLAAFHLSRFIRSR